MSGVQLGDCVAHGHVTERCCPLFRPLVVGGPTFKPAIDDGIGVLTPELIRRIRDRLIVSKPPKRR